MTGTGRAGRRRHLAPIRFEATGLSRAILAFVDLFRAPIRMFGVDYAPFRTLLEAWLILDGRRARRAKSQGDPTGIRMGLAISCILHAFVGLFGGIALVTIDDPVWGMGIAESLVMAMVTMTLIGDYLATLLETTDVDVVGPTPVDDRTVYAARVAHIVVYLGLIVGSLSLMPLLFGAFHYGFLFVPVWLVATALATLLCIALSFGIYLLAMRLFDMERFKNLVLYLQVGGMVVFIGSFQLLPVVVQRDNLDVLDARSWAMALLPPFHCGGLLALVLGDASPLTVTLAALAVGLPLALFAATLRLGATGFLAKLASMAVGSRSGAVHGRRRPLRDLLLRTANGRAGYDFVAALSSREQQFRMRTYPMIAVAAMVGIALAFRGGELDSAQLCGAIYLLALYTPMIVLQARYSESYEGRWVFRATPLERPADLVVGGFVALLTRFLLPAWVLLLAAILAIGGAGVLIDALFASEVVWIIAMASILVFGRAIPFTLEQEKNPGAGRMDTLFLMMLLVGLCAAGHVVARRFDPLFYGLLFVLPAIGLLLAARVRRMRVRLPWLRAAHEPGTRSISSSIVGRW